MPVTANDVAASSLAVTSVAAANVIGILESTTEAATCSANFSAPTLSVSFAVASNASRLAI